MSSLSPAERKSLIEKMKKMMRAARGVGLSANQIGFSYRLFVAEVPDRDGVLKFYTIFNPIIEDYSKDHDFLEEGCLSVPGTYGEVKRSLKLTLRGLDKNGKPIKIKAWGLLAHVFQHEVDHLDGKLFIDKAKHIQKVPQSDRLQKREKELKTRE